MPPSANATASDGGKCSALPHPPPCAPGGLREGPGRSPPPPPARHRGGTAPGGSAQVVWALSGKEMRWPQQRLGRRLEEVAKKAVGGRLLSVTNAVEAAAPLLTVLWSQNGPFATLLGVAGRSPRCSKVCPNTSRATLWPLLPPPPPFVVGTSRPGVFVMTAYRGTDQAVVGGCRGQ